MQKKFLSNLMVIQLLNLVVKTSWILLIDVTVQNLLGPYFYGEYFIVLNFCLLFILLLDLGINNLNAKSMAEDSGFIINRNRILLVKLFLSILYFVIVFFLGIWKDMNPLFLLLIAINQILLTYIQYFRSNLAGMHEFIREGVIGVLDKLIALVICLVLIATDDMSLELFIIAQSIGLFCALLVGLTLNLKLEGNKKVELSLPFWNLIKMAFPFALLTALMVIYTRIDAVMMDFLLPSESKELSLNGDFHVGIYAQSYRLLDAGNIFAVVLSGMLLPIFSRLIKRNQNPSELVSLSARIVLIPCAWIFTVALLFGPWLLDLIYEFEGDKVLIYSSIVFAYLMLAFVAMSLIYVYGTLLTAANQLKKLNIYAAVCVILNIGLNFILIPHFNEVGRPAEGASIATSVTQWIFVILCIVHAFKLFNLKIDWRFLGKFALYFTILIGIFLYLTYLNYTSTSSFLIYLACSILFMFLLRLVDFKWIKLNWGKFN